MGDKITEDEKVFGKDQWVYCSEHLRPHLTGWCTVTVRDKVALGVALPSTEHEAYNKCIELGLVNDTQKSVRA